jgi:hypothetical protein
MVGLKMLEQGGEMLYTVGWHDFERGRWILPENPRPEVQLDAIAWVVLPTYTCPHCSKPTEHPNALSFDRFLLSRSACRHCGREFLIVNDVPMTHSEYDHGGR